MLWSLLVFSSLITPQPDPALLPRLGQPQASGMIYSEVDPSGQPSVDAGWGQVVDRGLDGYELATGWRILVDPDGNPTHAPWLGLVDELNAGGLSVYFGISTIDTNNLQLPIVFIDPNNERELAQGINFDSPAVLEAFGSLLDGLVPELVSRDVFFMAIGNEVDVWLIEHPDQIGPYTTFLSFARDRIHSIAPDMSVGAPLTAEVIKHPEIAGPIIAASDLAVFTYYPLGPDSFNVRDPEVIGPEFDALLTLAGKKQVIFQEIGYPSGWPTSQINSSLEKQRRFVEEMFRVIESRPQIRFWSFLHLGDWNSAQLDLFTAYYGLDLPEFIEYLGTLGLFWTNGTPKPAFEAFLIGLGGCGVDVNEDGAIDTDDLYALTQSPTDINGDGIADADDAKCLEKYLRRFEMRNLSPRP